MEGYSDQFNIQKRNAAYRICPVCGVVLVKREELREDAVLT